ncbi:MAG: molybdopterin dinucleotide binding domain-containing protein, partial [Longimicrobiales bacterium]
PLDGRGRYPLSLITYKEPFGGHSRTISNYWSNVALRNENRIVINRRDAESLGFEDGQPVRMISAANPNGQLVLGDGRTVEAVGRLEVKEGIRPGVVAVSWHYGHWAYGSNDVEVDGVDVPGDPRRAAGLCPNMVMAVDPKLRDVCLTDPIGGSASFYDTQVRLVAV